MIIIRNFRSNFRLALSFFLAILLVTPARATAGIPDSYLNDLYVNGVYYYNPCGSSASTGVTGGTYSGGFGDAGPNADKILEFLVTANIPNFSDNPAAIAGVLGNMYQESGENFNPYAHTAGKNYYGVVQWGYYYDGARTAEADMIDRVTALGDYWGREAPTNINDEALKIELDYLVNQQERFKTYISLAAAAKSYAASNGLSLEDEAAMDAELFEVEVERAVNGSDALKFQPAIDRVHTLYPSGKYGIYYQGAADRRNNAVGALPKVQARVSSGASASTNTSGSSTSSSSTTTTTTTTVTPTSTASIDSDGWFIDGSIPGFQRESALDPAWINRLKDDPYMSYNTGKATAILLHYTAGRGPIGSSGLAVYGNNLYPAHFTIDLKERKAYQHFPLNQPSLATVYADRYTIQFEIVGVGYDNWSGADPSSPYNLKNFTDAEWDYLAQYLIPISNYTGIPLTSSVRWDSNRDNDRLVPNYTDYNLNLTGVIGHMHVQANKVDPGNIWPQVQAAIQRGGGSTGGGGVMNICGVSTGPSASPGSLSALQETVLKYAWPDGSHGATPMPAYAEAVEKHKSKADPAHYYVGDNGIDCGGWVTILMQDSGWDPNYNSGNGPTSTQEAYLKDPANGWEQFYPTNASELQPGDVGITDGHTWAYVGTIPGFATTTASASRGTRAPCAGSESVGYGGERWYRKVK